MYELVNTSLPNGLIPGTHGFAAVAMTKGLPDALRTRLETYCAYSHRTSAHDATYFKENPVNWFHVTLPQGDHVLGRVAPADFDYTGRTNRLARLLVFSKNEMPAIGGASVLAKEHARLSEAWSGEARWLEADKLTVGRLRLEFPSTNCDAPSWRAMFGDAEGLFLAKGFARLLAKNLSMAGRTIYFKTSTAYDIDGTKLLALFRDLIDLFPVIDRRNITFSTYPVALPQGTICHLRGVYNRDRIFDAATATQPWVDCEKGVVHNAALLPPEEVKQRKIESKVVPASVREKSQPSLPAYGAKQQVTPAWMPPPKKDETKVLLIGIIAIVVLLVAAAAICGIYWWRENERKIRENERQRQLAVAETIRIAEAEEKARRVKAEKEAAAKAQAEAERKKAEEDRAKTNAVADAKRKQDEAQVRANERMEREKNEAQIKAMCASAVAKSNELPAFVSAKSVKNIDGGIKNIAETGKHMKTNGTLKVFWYDSRGVLTNCFAGLVMPKSRVSKDPIFSPKPDELAKNARCFFLLWYDTKEKTIYWDWSPLGKKNPTEWFISTNMVDFVDMCFGGTTNETYKTWEKHCGAPHFTIDWVTTDGKSILTSLKTEGGLKLEELLNEYRKLGNKQQAPQMDSKEKKLAEYKTQRNKISNAKKRYDKHRANWEAKRNESTRCDDKKQETLRKERKKEEDEIDNVWNSIDKNDRAFFGVKIEYNDHKIERMDELLRKLDEEIGKLEPKQSSSDEKKEEEKKTADRIQIIRHSKFSIKKVEGAKR